MFKRLRPRLILSHVLPLLVITPLMGITLIYVLETQVLLPQLAENLVGDARLLAEISRNEYTLWGNPVLFERLLDRVPMQPGIRVMFLSPNGRLLYSSIIDENSELGDFIAADGVQLAMNGQQAVLTNYSGLRVHNVVVDVFMPVIGPEEYLIGIVRVTYQVTSVYEVFTRMRSLTIGVLILGLFVGVGLGSLLALNIGKPIQQVTKAIYELASGLRREELPEQGPQELREQSQAVNFLVARLHDLEQARRQLLANLVHELGRPLGALRSAIHALSQGAGDDPQLFQDLSKGMDEEAERLQTVLEELAHLHDQVVGTLELRRESINLNEWLPRTLSPWEAAAQEKRLHWEIDLQENLPDIYADQLRLSQVVGNLVSNAIKFTPPGRKVSVSAGEERGEVWIKISDNGPGIAKDEQEKVFTPFYRGSRGRRIQQGMGLGLGIAKALAEAHGGRIEVDSSPGFGSSFTFWLPYRR